jgi:hypothetical protein
MEIWAIFGFVVAVCLVYFLTMWALQKLTMKAGVNTTRGGVTIIVVSMAYASYVTWAITSSNVPFLSGG